MKSIRSSILTSAATLLALCGSAMAVGIQATNGDLVIGFYTQDPVSGIFGSTTYLYNLGPASLYRENTQPNVSISAVNTAISASDANISADLTAAFGGDWAENPSLRWVIVGGANQLTVGTLRGDNAYSSYTSRPIDEYKASGPSSARINVSGTTRIILGNNIQGFFDSNSNVGTTTSGGRGAIIPLSTVPNSNLTTFVPAGAHFELNEILTQGFGVGFVPGTTDTEGALDIWRHINSVTEPGMDYTSGASGSVNAVRGQGQFCGSITIDFSGELKVGATSDAPPAGNYASFATENGLTAAGEDTDGDGVKNLIEYALATNLTGPDPGLGALVDRTISFNKREVAVANGDITYTIEESDDLGVTDAWQPVAASDTTTNISYTLPSGKGKVFARLKVTQAQ